MTIENAVSKLQMWCRDVQLPWHECASWRFERFIQLLEHGQELTNLTGFSTPEALVDGLFIDSLQIMRSGKLCGSVMDVGTGAGFPAIPIKIMNPELEMILVEPRTKRYAFLRMIERELKLNKLTIHKAKIEQVSVPENLGIAISKAFAPLPEWIEMARPWAKNGTHVACLVSEDDWKSADLKDYQTQFVLDENKRIYAILSLNG